jgi:serine/threonine protein kinase
MTCDVKLPDDPLNPPSFSERRMIPTPSQLRSQVVDLTDYAFESQLFSDHYRSFYLGRHIPSKSPVLIRQFSQKDLDSRNEELFNRQISLFIQSQCPFIVRFLGYTAVTPFSLITDFFPNGSLHDAIHKNYRKFTATQKTAIAFGVAQSLKWLHGLDIVHGNLTSRSVLLDECGLPRLNLSRATVRVGEEDWVVA